MDFYLFTEGKEAVLPKTLFFEGNWQVSLSELYLPSVKASCYLCTELVEPSIINSIQLPVIRRLFPGDYSSGFEQEQFFKVGEGRVRVIRFTLKDKEGASLTLDKLECTLHFQWLGP
jgi:hypothetical protein